jgi:Cu2+-containing amine oxidase
LRFLGSSLTLKVTRIAFSILALVSLIVPGAMALQAQDTSRQVASDRRALDPLNRDEIGAAEQIARSDAKVRELLGESGVRVVSVTPVLLKAESPEKTNLAQRQVEVVLFRPQDEVGARVIVNLQRNGVVALHRLRPDQVPMTNDDLADAFQLALRDADVQKSLGTAASTFRIRTDVQRPPENSVGGLPVRSTDPNDPCSKHRCMRLTFRRGHDYLSEPIVVVDLTAKRVYVQKRNPDRKADH